MIPFRERFIHNFAETYPFDKYSVEKLEEVHALMQESKVDNWNQLSHILVLGASMDKHPNGEWKHSSRVESDPFCVVGGHSRVTSVGYIFCQGFDGDVIITGGTQYFNDGKNKISRAQVMADDIICRYRIPQHQVHIVGSEGNGNTKGNITDTEMHMRKNISLFQGKKIGFLTNEWHMPRSLLLFLNHPFFQENEISFAPIIADDIMRRIGRWHAEWSYQFARIPEMTQREIDELRGMDAFFRNMYTSASS